MSPIPEQEARASQTARELLKPVGFLLVSDRIEAIAIVARHLLAEREKLDGAESQLDAFRHRDETQLRSIKLIAEQRDAAETARDGARAAALREVEVKIRALNSGGVQVTGKGAWAGAIACCASIAKELRLATPPTSAATTGKETP